MQRVAYTFEGHRGCDWTTYDLFLISCLLVCYTILCRAVDGYKFIYMKRWFVLFSACFMYSITTLVVVLMFSALETFDTEQRIFLVAITVMGYFVGSIYLLLYTDRVKEDKRRYGHPKNF